MSLNEFEDNTRSYLYDLPDEIIKYIASFLDKNSQYRLLFGLSSKLRKRFYGKERICITKSFGLNSNTINKFIQLNKIFKFNNIETDSLSQISVLLSYIRPYDNLIERLVLKQEIENDKINNIDIFNTDSIEYSEFFDVTFGVEKIILKQNNPVESNNTNRYENLVNEYVRDFRDENKLQNKLQNNSEVQSFTKSSNVSGIKKIRINNLVLFLLSKGNKSKSSFKIHLGKNFDFDCLSLTSNEKIFRWLKFRRENNSILLVSSETERLLNRLEIEGCFSIMSFRNIKTKNLIIKYGDISSIDKTTIKEIQKITEGLTLKDFFFNSSFNVEKTIKRFKIICSNECRGRRDYPSFMIFNSNMDEIQIIIESSITNILNFKIIGSQEINILKVDKKFYRYISKQKVFLLNFDNKGCNERRINKFLINTEPTDFGYISSNIFDSNINIIYEGYMSINEVVVRQFKSIYIYSSVKYLYIQNLNCHFESLLNRKKSEYTERILQIRKDEETDLLINNLNVFISDPKENLVFLFDCTPCNIKIFLVSNNQSVNDESYCRFYQSSSSCKCYRDCCCNSCNSSNLCSTCISSTFSSSSSTTQNLKTNSTENNTNNSGRYIDIFVNQTVNRFSLLEKIN